jgi:preflagellin peptidase FlaK
LRLVFYSAALLLILLAGILSSGDAAALGGFWRLIVMPGMIVVAHGLYYVNLLRGGADAKAAMALGLLFPGVYPHVAGFPILAAPPLAEPVLAVWFPFAFVTVVNAALLFIVVPLGFLARNAADRTAKGARALVGYTVPIGAVPRYAWLLDRVEDGRVVARYSPHRTEDERKDRSEQLALLKDMGIARVWITPKLPFVTAILVGYTLAVVLGNPLLSLFRGPGP